MTDLGLIQIWKTRFEIRPFHVFGLIHFRAFQGATGHGWNWNDRVDHTLRYWCHHLARREQSGRFRRPIGELPSSQFKELPRVQCAASERL